MSIDNTVKIFNSFYDIDLAVNANEFEIVNSFFSEKITDSKLAKSLTESIFKISTITNINSLELLKTFESNDQLSILVNMAYYLNSINDNKTVMYGVNSLLAPNEKVQRNIVQ